MQGPVGPEGPPGLNGTEGPQGLVGLPVSISILFPGVCVSNHPQPLDRIKLDKSMMHTLYILQYVVKRY